MIYSVVARRALDSEGRIFSLEDTLDEALVVATSLYKHGAFLSGLSNDQVTYAKTAIQIQVLDKSGKVYYILGSI